LYLVISGVLWGTGGLTGSLLSRTAGLSSIAVATYRLAVGGALIILFLVLAGRRLPRGRAAWARIVVVGVLSAVFQGAYFAAVSLTSVTLATLVTIGISPVLVLVAERATGRRRLDRAMISTVLLALAGLSLLVGLPSGGFGVAAIVASVGLAVLAAGGFAAVTLLGSKPVPGLDELTTTGLAFTLGGLLLVPLAGTTASLRFNPNAVTIGLLIVLGTAPTAVAYTLYFRGLRTVGASTAAVMALVEPLTSALLAALVLGDRLGVAGTAGAVLLVVAVVMAARTPKRHSVEFTDRRRECIAGCGRGGCRCPLGGLRRAWPW
jgi:DME family drug/metabolite transporter